MIRARVFSPAALVEELVTPTGRCAGWLPPEPQMRCDEMRVLVSYRCS